MPPNERERYIGCALSVYSRTPRARARFTYHDVLQAADSINVACRGAGRGGKVQLYNEAHDSVIPGWYVKLEFGARNPQSQAHPAADRKE